MLTDLRHALRSLRKTPAFTGLAVLVLALGIGLTTSIFSVINAALYAPPHVPPGGELRYVYADADFRPGFGGYGDLQFVRRNNDVFQDLAGSRGDAAKLGEAGDAHVVRGEAVSSNYFDVLRLTAVRGRTFNLRDDEPNAPLTVVISDALWAREFGRDPNVLGRTVHLEYRGQPSDVQWPDYTVVGVMSAEFKGVGGSFEPADYWVPLGQRVRDHSVTTAGVTRVLTINDSQVVVVLPVGRARPAN